MDQSDLVDLSVNSEHHFVLLEKRENKEKLAALLQSIVSLGLGEDPVQQLVQVAQLGMRQLHLIPEGERLGSYLDARTEGKSGDSDRSFSRTDLQKCPICHKHFQGTESLEHHLVRRHAEAGARTERKPPTRKGNFEQVQRAFAVQYEALEKSVLALNGQQTKVQNRLSLLEPSTSEACAALRTAVKLQEQLNHLLEKQRTLLDAQAIQFRELQSHIRDSGLSSCTVPASVPSHTASLSSFAEPPRLPRYPNPPFWQRKRHLSRESWDSGPALAPSASTSRLGPQAPKEPITGPKTSRRGLYRPSTRYRPLEMSTSDMREETLAQVREKTAELRGTEGKYEVMEEKYGLELCAAYKHSREDIEITRSSLGRRVDSLMRSGHTEELQALIAGKRNDAAYSTARDTISKKALLLASYQAVSPDFPLKLLPKSRSKVPLLHFSYRTDESLHANTIPKPSFPLNLSPLQTISHTFTQDLTFYEGSLEARVPSTLIIPIPDSPLYQLGRQIRTVRESLITLDLNESVSFSIVWGDEETDEEEWRVLGMEDAQRLGFFP